MAEIFYLAGYLGLKSFIVISTRDFYSFLLEKQSALYRLPISDRSLLTMILRRCDRHFTALLSPFGVIASASVIVGHAFH